jgi:uncharacterized protein
MRLFPSSSSAFRSLFLAPAAAFFALSGIVYSQQPPAAPAKPAPIKHVLVVAEAKGYEHDSISAAMVAVYEMGKQSGLWDATLRTDTELLTKKKLDRNAKNLDYFDAIVFASPSGEMTLDDSQKADLITAIHDEGKGFVGIHAALDANKKWPEYGEMLGGHFDVHPWNTFDAPIVNEAPDFPAVKHFPKAFTRHDEIYQSPDFNRSNANVLLSLDPNKLDWNNPRVHRTDKDYAVAWVKMYGKGRVFYSSLGHTVEAWDDPDIRKMYFEGIKWALGLTEGSTATHPRPAPQP